MASTHAADTVSQHAFSSARAWTEPAPEVPVPVTPPLSTATVPLRTRPIEAIEGYMFLDKSTVYHYTDCTEAGNARYSGRSLRPPAERRLAHCYIGWGMPEGFYYASDVMNLLTADIRARISAATGQDDRHPGGAGASRLQDMATAAAVSVARSCHPRLPPLTGYVDDSDGGVYHTLRVCPLLARHPVAADESVPTDGRRVCRKCGDGGGGPPLGPRRRPGDSARGVHGPPAAGVRDGQRLLGEYRPHRARPPAVLGAGHDDQIGADVEEPARAQPPLPRVWRAGQRHGGSFLGRVASVGLGLELAHRLWGYPQQVGWSRQGAWRLPSCPDHSSAAGPL